MTLRPFWKHQVPMFEYFCETKHPALIAEMRLGKNMVTIRGAIEKGAKKILVNSSIPPFKGWKDDLRADGEEFVEAYGRATKLKEDAILRAFDSKNRVFVLTNYESYRHAPEIADIPWDMVVCDESKRLANPQAQITKLFLSRFRDVPTRVILNGIIAPENPLEVFCQFVFLNDLFLGKKGYYAFRDKYFEPEEDGYGWTPKPGVRDLIKKAIAEKAYILSRKDAGLKEQKIYSIRSVPMTPAQQKVYEQVEKEFAYEFDYWIKDPSFEMYGETIWATEKFLWMESICGGLTPKRDRVLSKAKPDDILYLLRNDLKGEPVVIFYRFVDELILDLHLFSAKGIKCTCMYGTAKEDHFRATDSLGLKRIIKPGKLSTYQLEKNEDDWNDGIYDILLCTERLVAKGKDFSKSDITIFRSNEHSNDIRSQAIERTFRPDKDKPLFIIDMVTEGTVDESTIEDLQMKRLSARELQNKLRLKDAFKK